jgi:CheY-like chemotaxis protein
VTSILYIEDGADNIRLVERILRRRPDVDLHVAMTGRDGVQAAETERPALILLDNRLPDASGSDVLKRLNAAEATATIPVIVVSGDTGSIITNELRAAGAVGFISKPFEISDFLSEIDRYLA